MKGNAFFSFFKTRKGVAVLVAAALGALGINLAPEQTAVIVEAVTGLVQ